MHDDALSRWTGHAPVDRSYAANGLNQYTAVSGVGYCHDANGNLTADNSYAYLYDVENRLVEMRARVGATCPTTYTGQIKASLRYDPLGRLHEVTNFIAGVSQGPTRFLYDGDALVAEFDGAGSVLRRHVHGPNAGVDDPLIEYANPYVAPGYAYVRFLYADARGSIVYRADSANTSAAINTYDEYGVPGSANSGRFQYTGQAWLAELGMYYYKARIYSPTLGRFLQTDPIGYEDNNNLYAYVANDLINAIDPSGKDTFYVSRTAGGLSESNNNWPASNYDHGFVVVADEVGGEIKAIFSYTNIDGNLRPAGMDQSIGSTYDGDTQAWGSLAGDDSQGVTFNRVNVSDEATIAAGQGIDRALTVNDVPYAALPTSRGAGCNSNCGAAAVANTARDVGRQGGNHPAPRGSQSAPGRAQSGRIEGLVRTPSERARARHVIVTGSRIRRERE